MNEIRERALPAVIALFALAPLWSGCSGPEDAVSFEATKAGAIMTTLRDHHGGVARFRRFEGVVFSYRVEFRDQVRHFDRVGFRFVDSDRLWIRSSPEADTLLLTLRERSEPLRAHPITAIATAAATPDGIVGLTRARALESADGPINKEQFPEPELDLALRSIHFLFEPSLMTSAGPWQYRTLLAPGHADNDVKRVEVEPWPSFSVDGNYLLESDPRTGLLSQILYRGTHPVVRGRTQLVAFDDYAPVQGVAVARRRIHRRPVDTEERELRRNPFVMPSPEREETFLTERLDGIRFLTAAEADELLPLPLEENEASSSVHRKASRDRLEREESEIEFRAPQPLPLFFPIELAPRSATITSAE